MGISDALQQRLEQYVESLSHDDVHRLSQRTPQDWSRRGIEAMTERLGDPRELTSRGVLRFHGGGVDGHRASLSSVGLLAEAWQRAVTAVGAALEGHKAVRGKIPSGISERTSLMLEAAPEPGSVIFNITPKGDALEEIEPEGQRSLMEDYRGRPLVDKASERVVSLIGDLANANLEATDSLARTLGDLGARVGANLSHLANMISKSDIAVDLSWEEPRHETIRSRVSPEQARWISSFITQRELTRETDELTGYLKTVSGGEDKWRVELDDGTPLRLVATGISGDVAAKYNVYDRVIMTVEITHSVRPDGGNESTYTLTGVRPAPDEDAARS